VRVASRRLDPALPGQRVRASGQRAMTFPSNAGPDGGFSPRLVDESPAGRGFAITVPVDTSAPSAVRHTASQVMDYLVGRKRRLVLKFAT
jgi:hypothetical protein